MSERICKPLNNLHRVLIECQRAGIEIKIAPFWYEGGMNTVVILEGVIFEDGELRLRSGKHEASNERR